MANEPTSGIMSFLQVFVFHQAAEIFYLNLAHFAWIISFSEFYKNMHKGNKM